MVTTNGSANKGGVGSNQRFLPNISEIGARSRHSYYGTPIGTRMCSI